MIKKFFKVFLITILFSFSLFAKTLNNNNNLIKYIKKYPDNFFLVILNGMRKTEGHKVLPYAKYNNFKFDMQNKLLIVNILMLPNYVKFVPEKLENHEGLLLLAKVYELGLAYNICKGNKKGYKALSIYINKYGYRFKYNIYYMNNNIYLDSITINKQLCKIVNKYNSVDSFIKDNIYSNFLK